MRRLRRAVTIRPLFVFTTTDRLPFNGSTMSYAFRFYGRRPSTWTGGGYLNVHYWEVSFRSPPTESQRERIAAAYETNMAAGPARRAPEPWQWSGRFARLPLKEYEQQKLFSRAAELLEIVHKIAPIDDAIYCGSQGAGRGAWQEWSEAKQAKPNPGPAHGDTPSGRPIDDSLPSLAPDPRFEAARDATLRAARDAEIEALNRGQGIRLVRFDAASIPPETRAFPSEELGDLTAYPVPGTPHPVFTLLDHDRNRSIAVVDNKDVKRVEFPEDSSLRGAIAVHRDGKRGLASVVWGAVFEIDFETGVAGHRFDSERSAVALAYLGDLWLVRTLDAIVVYDGALSPPRALARAKLKADWYSGARVVHNNVIITTYTDSKTVRTHVFGWCPEAKKLKKLQGLGVDALSVLEVGNQTVLKTGRDEYFTLDGLHEVYEAWARPLREKAAKKAAKAGKSTASPKVKKPAAKLGLEQVDACPEPRQEPNHPRVVVPAESMPEGLHTPSATRQWFSVDGTIGACPSKYDLGIVTFTPDGTSAKDVIGYQPDETRGSVATIEFFGPNSMLIQWEPPAHARGKNKNAGRRLELVHRRRTWKLADSAVVKQSKRLVRSGDVVAVLADAKDGLILYAVDGTHLIKVGAIKEKFAKLVVDTQGGLFVETPEGTAFRVTGVAETAAKKVAAAAKKRSK